MSEIVNLEFWVFVGVIAGIFSIFALGLQLQFGFTGLLNFGHVAFMAIGAYTMAILVVKAGLPLWLSSLIAIAVSMIFGALIGLPTLRLRADYLAIATIAFSEIVRFIALNESALTGGPQGTINLLGAGRAANFNAEWQDLLTAVEDFVEGIFGDQIVDRNFTMAVLVWIVVLGLLVILRYLTSSPWGRVLRSIREDEDAASALGKNAFFYKVQSLAIGAALAAIAGLFFAFQFSFFSPQDFDPLTTFFAWIIVILGGTSTYIGVPIGALIFGFIFAGTRFFDFPPFSYFSPADQAFLRLVIIGIILILLMAFRPEGLLGKRQEMVLE